MCNKLKLSQVKSIKSTAIFLVLIIQEFRRVEQEPPSLLPRVSSGEL